VIGTHALIQEAVQFARLGLVMVDEQHRFGVGQRLTLRNKGSDGAGAAPVDDVGHADPAHAGDDLLRRPGSVRHRRAAAGPHADRHARHRPEPPRRSDRARACGRAGRPQIYWVCPLIEESEALQLQTATDTHALLAEALPDLVVGLVHGRMKPAEKQQIMDAFSAGDMHVLVATTVIEVGVDVPNASLMVIEHAERFGLSQLHQLRGRVGRGSAASVCLLLYQSPLGGSPSSA
jgi:ATP-dependent DNA helicase RecG